jgi:hypothetical protein
MTITLTREEAQQVLEHLDDLVEAQQWEIDMHITQYGEEYKPHRVKHMRERLASTNGTIEILRVRLAQPEPEPVAWMHDQKVGFNVPLYTAPPQREWQGLTDEEAAEVERWVEFKEEGSGRIPTGKLIRAIEAKLKEKNSAT